MGLKATAQVPANHVLNSKCTLNIYLLHICSYYVDTVPYNNDYKHTRPNINCGSLSGTFTCHDGHYFILITISMSNTRPALGESCNGVKGRLKQLLERGRQPCTGHTQTIHKINTTTLLLLRLAGQSTKL